MPSRPTSPPRPRASTGTSRTRRSCSTWSSTPHWARCPWSPGAPDRESWQDELRRLAAELAALSARHPWWPPLYSTRPSIGPRALEFSEHLIRTLHAAGFTGPAVDAAETAFYDVVVGHVLIASTWQTWLARTPHDIEQTQAYVLRASQAHPTLHAHIVGLFEAPDRAAAGRARFDFAVDVLVHGLERMLGQHSTS